MVPGSVFVIHWHEAEALVHAEMLATAGWVVAGFEAADGRRAYQLVKETRPDLLMVYLTRKPARGRRTAEAICSLKAFHSLPVLFVGGTEPDIERIRLLIPDALFVNEGGETAVLNQLTRSFA